MTDQEATIRAACIEAAAALIAERNARGGPSGGVDVGECARIARQLFEALQREWPA